MRTQHSHFSVRQASSDVIVAHHLPPKAPLPLTSLFRPSTALTLVPPSSSTALSRPPVARAPASSSAPAPPFQSGNTSRRPTLSSRSPPQSPTHTPHGVFPSAAFIVTHATYDNGSNTPTHATNKTHTKKASRFPSCLLTLRLGALGAKTTYDTSSRQASPTCGRHTILVRNWLWDFGTHGWMDGYG
jgi:hypothetical protein